MAAKDREPDNLTGKMLAAMPGMPDERFERSLVYLCAHSDSGAMGLVVNDINPDLSFAAVIRQLDIEAGREAEAIPVYQGGPVENGRGFVLHSPDYVHDNTMVIDDKFALTATVDVLHAIAEGRGPKRMVFTLGYAGWGEGQLDEEIQRNGWLVVDSDADIVFDRDAESKWSRALGRLGIDPSLLSSQAGHA